MRLFRVLAVVLLVLVAGTSILAAAFGERLLAAAIERAGPALLGREVRVGGVSIDWGFPTSAAATDLVVDNADRGADTPLLRAERAEVTVALLNLLRLRVLPVRLTLRQPALHLARDAQGRWNLPWAGGGASGGASPIEFEAPREVEVENGEVTVDDLASPGVEARIAALSARATPSGTAFRGTASLEGGAQVDVSGEAGPVAALFRVGAGPFPVRLAIGPEKARLSAVGHLARPLDLAGVDLGIEAQGDERLRAVSRRVRRPGRRHAAVPLHSAPLTDIERGWSLRDIAARVGESWVEGEASALLAGRRRPFLRYDLAAPFVAPSDLGWLAPGGGQGGATSGSLAGARLPTAAWLRQADAEGDLRVERLEGLANEPVGLRSNIELKDGRLRLQPLRIELAGGAAEGSATVEAVDGAPPRTGLRLEAADGLRLGPLLAAFGVDGFTGRVGTASVDVRGQGATVGEVAAGLDGVARFRVADGGIRVPGLARLSMGLVETFGAVLGVGGDAGATPVACAVGDLPVRRGVVLAERLVVVTPRVAVTAEGTLRLGDGALRLTLTPIPLDEALFRVVVPVVISGDLASPEVTPHPELRVGVRPEPAADVCAEEAGRR